MRNGVVALRVRAVPELLQCKNISLKVRSLYQKLNYTIYLQYKGVVCYANIKVLTFSINVFDTWGDMKGECI